MKIFEYSMFIHLWFMVLNATFNNISVISWRSVLLGEETKVPGEKHRHPLNVKGIQAAVRIDFFLFILKVANIRCFMLIKCSEQEARFKKICYNVVIS
jgi:hypothetical protein